MTEAQLLQTRVSQQRALAEQNVQQEQARLQAFHVNLATLTATERK